MNLDQYIIQEKYGEEPHPEEIVFADETDYYAALFERTPSLKPTDKSQRFINLIAEIPDIEKYIQADKVNIVPLPPNEKGTKEEGWNSKKHSYSKLKLHNGNYGILIGWKHAVNGESIACIDIDGYTMEGVDDDKKTQVKKVTQQYIYDCLKDLPDSMQVRTQSGGYHIYLWNKTIIKEIHQTSKSLSFPADCPIPELAGKSLNQSIEIFTKENSRQMVLPSSRRNGNVYKVIGAIHKLSDIGTVKDINQTVIDALIANGFGYAPGPKTDKQSQSNSLPKVAGLHIPDKHPDLKSLNDDDIKRVVSLTSPIFRTVGNGKHYAALYLGGYLSRHIDKGSTSKICNGIIREVGNLFDDTRAFKHTMLDNYGKTTDKAGLPTLCNHILKHDGSFNVNKFSDELESICNSKFSKQLVDHVLVNDYEVCIYLYDNPNAKYLRYEEFIQGIDLIINLNTHIGQFKSTSTEKEITSFKFKFKDKFFDISKVELEDIDAMLELPDHFIQIVRTSINNLDSSILAPKPLSKEEELGNLFKKRNREGYARKELGKYLHEHGMILRKGLNNPYLQNEYYGYDSVENDDILQMLYDTGNFELNSLHTDDIKVSLGFISERLKPTHNIVKFPNCLYDMRQFELLETPEHPILTLTEVKYNYNPEAKGKLIVEFLESSLKQPGDTEEDVQERIKAFYEMVGYLLVSGNPFNAWFLLLGIGGSGKGTASRIIIAIFGYEKVGALVIQELTPDNRFATSHLENKQVNIVRDSSKKPIEDTGMIKSITGYDDIPIEPKGKDKYILPKEEVPDMITVANNMPRFKDGYDESLLQRAVIFEFPNQFRNTDQENKTLEEDIINNTEEMEFLIYQGIMAYKDMVDNNRDFRARISPEKTMEILGKHTNPIAYLLPRLVRFNAKAEDDGEEPIISDELNQLLVYLAKKEGLNLTGLNKDGVMDSRKLLGNIRHVFGFEKDYKTEPKNYFNGVEWESKRAYPYLSKTAEYDDYLAQMEADK